MSLRAIQQLGWSGPPPADNMITFYHDTEQDFGIKADVAACRQVVAEFLGIERKYGICATYNVVGKIYREQPKLIQQITDAGHEISFHSYHHTYEPENYPNEILLCRQLSRTVRGYRSPKSKWNTATLHALWKNRFLWSAENDREREPYFIHQGLVRLPIALCDWTIQDGQLNEEQWVKTFARLMEQRPYFGFGTHDCVVSLNPEARLKAYEQVIQAALQKKALIVNFSEAADLFRRAAVARFRRLSGRDWHNTILDIQDEPTEFSDRMREIPLSGFEFEFRNRELHSFIRSSGKYFPAPIRKFVRKFNYFKDI